jgi:hypothetical protein
MGQLSSIRALLIGCILLWPVYGNAAGGSALPSPGSAPVDAAATLPPSPAQEASQRVLAGRVHIDFENARHPSALPDTDATGLYAHRGVTFSSTAFIYDAGRAARSGTHVLRNRAPHGGAGHPLIIRLDPRRNVRRVEFFAGLQTRSRDTIYVAANGIEPVGGTRSPTAVPGGAGAAGSFSVPREVVVASQELPPSGDGRAGILFTLISPQGRPPITTVVVASGSPGAIMIDDLVLFGDAVPAPPAVSPPQLEFDRERSDTAVAVPTTRTSRTGAGEIVSAGGGTAAATVRLMVSAEVHVNRVRVFRKGPDGEETYDVCGGTVRCQDATSFTLTWRRSYTAQQIGAQELTAVAYDDRGSVSAPARMRFGVLAESGSIQMTIGGREVVSLDAPRGVLPPAAINDFSIEIVHPDHLTLSEVNLILDDTSMVAAGVASADGVGDTSVSLMTAGRPRDDLIAGLRLEERSLGAGYFRKTLRFALPLWQPGTNDVMVVASAGHPRRSVSAFKRMRLLVPESFGATRASDTAVFQLPGIPMWATGCPFAFCKDADQDGLLDLWENVAVESLRPSLYYRQDEDLLRHPEHHVQVFTRVAPFTLREWTCLTSERCERPAATWCRRPSHATHIVFLNAIAFAKDYGYPNRFDLSVPVEIADVLGWIFGTDLTPPVVSDGYVDDSEDVMNHNGDVEKFAVAWRIDPTDRGQIGLEAMWSSAHAPLRECSSRDGAWAIGPVCDLINNVTENFGDPTEYFYSTSDVRPPFEFTANGVLKLYLEEDKHGIWPSSRVCNRESPYKCCASAGECEANSSRRRPPAINVGETADGVRFLDSLLVRGGRPLIDQLDWVAPHGPHGSVAGRFPREAIWSTNQWDTDPEFADDFCGGLGFDGECSNRIGDKLTRTTPPDTWRLYWTSRSVETAFGTTVEQQLVHEVTHREYDVCLDDDPDHAMPAVGTADQRGDDDPRVVSRGTLPAPFEVVADAPVVE